MASIVNDETLTEIPEIESTGKIEVSRLVVCAFEIKYIYIFVLTQFINY